MRAQTDLFLLGLARAASGLWFREVQVVGRDRLPQEGPVLVVASHFNGMLDPVLVAQSSLRMPRFLAKAAFWRNPVAARLLDLVGALPVTRPGEGSSEGSAEGNAEMFAACSAALADGQLVALFPEGITHDEPRVTALRTGAARIALGARSAGARGLRIVPVGLVYSAKQRPRSRALVRIGRPIRLDTDLATIVGPRAAGEEGRAVGADDVEAVRLLTEEIRRRLADAALDYEHADVALAAAYAAAVALRPPDARRRWSPSLHDLERCARSIVAAPTDAQQAVVDALSLYADDLALLGVTDADLVAGDLTPGAVRFQLGRLAAYTAATPIALLGTAVNGPAVGMVWAAGYLPVSTPMRATARLLTGLALLPASWLALWLYIGRRTSLRDPTLLALLGGPGAGLVALGMAERLRALRSARASLTRLRQHAAVVPTLWAARVGVVGAVAGALAASDDEDLLADVHSAAAGGGGAA